MLRCIHKEKPKQREKVMYTKEGTQALSDFGFHVVEIHEEEFRGHLFTQFVCLGCDTVGGQELDDRKKTVTAAKRHSKNCSDKIKQAKGES